MTAALELPKLRRFRLVANGLTATKWDTPEDKAKTGNAILAFIAKGMREEVFSKTLYRRVCQMWGFIACYNRDGFAGRYFGSTQGKIAFLEHIARHRCYGDPEWTWSDVERCLRDVLHEHQICAFYRAELRREQNEREKATLRALLSRHGLPPDLAPAEMRISAVLTPPASRAAPTQMGLL